MAEARVRLDSPAFQAYRILHVILTLIPIGRRRPLFPIDARYPLISTDSPSGPMKTARRQPCSRASRAPA